MDNALAQWISVVAAGVMIASILALARILIGKANKAEVDTEFAELRLGNTKQADEGLRQYRELRTAIEGVQKEIAVLDKNSLTRSDLIEIKGDIKELVKGMAESQKMIDGMPDRLVSLEATRNKQSEK